MYFNNTLSFALPLKPEHEPFWCNFEHKTIGAFLLQGMRSFLHKQKKVRWKSHFTQSFKVFRLVETQNMH